jgi:hypothetical protein
MPDLLEPDLYAVLGVEPRCSREELRAAYRQLARVLHPDLSPKDPFAERRFRHVSAAYATLSSPTSRAAYDAARTAQLDTVLRLEPDRIDVLLRTGRSVTRRVSIVGDMRNLTAPVTAGVWWRLQMPTASSEPMIDITFTGPPEADGELLATIELLHPAGRLELPLRARIVPRRRALRRVAA